MAGKKSLQWLAARLILRPWQDGIVLFVCMIFLIPLVATVWYDPEIYTAQDVAAPPDMVAEKEQVKQTSLAKKPENGTVTMTWKGTSELPKDQTPGVGPIKLDWQTSIQVPQTQASPNHPPTTGDKKGTHSTSGTEAGKKGTHLKAPTPAHTVPAKTSGASTPKKKAAPVGASATKTAASGKGPSASSKSSANRGNSQGKKAKALLQDGSPILSSIPGQDYLSHRLIEGYAIAVFGGFVLLTLWESGRSFFRAEKDRPRAVGAVRLLLAAVAAGALAILGSYLITEAGAPNAMHRTNVLILMGLGVVLMNALHTLLYARAEITNHPLEKFFGAHVAGKATAAAAVIGATAYSAHVVIDHNIHHLENELKKSGALKGGTGTGGTGGDGGTTSGGNVGPDQAMLTALRDIHKDLITNDLSNQPMSVAALQRRSLNELQDLNRNAAGWGGATIETRDVLRGAKRFQEKAYNNVVTQHKELQKATPKRQGAQVAALKRQFVMRQQSLDNAFQALKDAEILCQRVQPARIASERDWENNLITAQQHQRMVEAELQTFNDMQHARGQLLEQLNGVGNLLAQSEQLAHQEELDALRLNAEVIAANTHDLAPYGSLPRPLSSESVKLSAQLSKAIDAYAGILKAYDGPKPPDNWTASLGSKMIALRDALKGLAPDNVPFRDGVATALADSGNK